MKSSAVRKRPAATSPPAIKAQGRRDFFCRSGAARGKMIIQAAIAKGMRKAFSLEAAAKRKAIPAPR